jgi:muramidase (phage lysozyme)
MLAKRKWIVIVAVPLIIVVLLLLYFKFIQMKLNTLIQGNDVASQNIKAFLKMIRNCEGTTGNGGYTTAYGYVKFYDLKDHPAVTGEWKGAKLTDSQCKGAGLSSGCISTAAGAYQITRTTWKALKLKLSLPDFSPNSQDLAALELIREKGALVDVQNGRVKEAINKVRKVWASLPNAGYGQPEKSLTAALGYYTSAGGKLA